MPTAADFTISLKILTRQCFGSAGCVISYRPELTQHVPYGSFDPSVTYDVTYVVSGDQSGPQTDTLYVTGDNYQQPDQGEAETAGSGVRLTVKITDVSAE